MTHWPFTVEVTASLEAASHTVSETMGTSTSSRTLELAAGQDAIFDFNFVKSHTILNESNLIFYFLNLDQ